MLEAGNDLRVGQRLTFQQDNENNDNQPGLQWDGVYLLNDRVKPQK